MEIMSIIRAEIEKRIKACQTKNGFPAGSICAIRIETYQELLSGLEPVEKEIMKNSLSASVWESSHGFKDLEIKTKPFQRVMSRFKDGDKVKVIILKEEK